MEHSLRAHLSVYTKADQRVHQPGAGYLYTFLRTVAKSSFLLEDYGRFKERQADRMFTVELRKLSSK